MKMVLVKSVAHDYTSAVEVNEDGYLSLDYYIESGRIPVSEIIDIEFPELDNKEVINAEVAVLDKQMTKVRADAEASITALEGRKQELLSISHEVV